MSFADKIRELQVAECDLKASGPGPEKIESNEVSMIERWRSRRCLNVCQPVSKEPITKLRALAFASSKSNSTHKRVSTLIREIDQIRRIRRKTQPSLKLGDCWSGALNIEYTIGKLWSKLLTTNADAQNYIAAHYYVLLLKKRLEILH